MNYIKDLKLCQTNGKCSISISDHDDDGDSDNDDSCWLFACTWMNSWTYPCCYASFPRFPLKKGNLFLLGTLSSVGPPILLHLREGRLPVSGNLECVESPAVTQTVPT